jgi:hypothetical protein
MGLDRSAVSFSFFTILMSMGFAFFILDPLWKSLDIHVPGEPNVKVDLTQPVDTIFYVRNAELGYRWDTSVPTSLWFHPLLSWSLHLLPRTIPSNYRLWALSNVAAFCSLIVVYRYTNLISLATLHPRTLILVPLLPGCLGITTANAEFPCLLFTSLLLVSVLCRYSYYYPILWGALAILAKPNALYLVLPLGVYLVGAVL